MKPSLFYGDKRAAKKNVTKNTRPEKCAEIKSHARHPSLVTVPHPNKNAARPAQGLDALL
jgi:hypothetical protein